MADEQRYQALATKHGLLDEAQHGFVGGSVDVPMFITSQLLENARISRTDLCGLFMDQHHAFGALDKLTGIFLSAQRRGFQDPAAKCAVNERGGEEEGEEEEEEEEECSICLGGAPADTQLPCEHVFCETCIADWADRNEDPFPCPMCRAECSKGALDDIRHHHAVR